MCVCVCVYACVCVHNYSYIISFECYTTVELATSLNDPEGFLIQARNGTDVSSEIVGTFLDPDVVRVRNPTMQINYKILRCNHSISDTESEAPIPVS